MRLRSRNLTNSIVAPFHCNSALAASVNDFARAAPTGRHETWPSSALGQRDRPQLRLDRCLRRADVTAASRAGVAS